MKALQRTGTPHKKDLDHGHTDGEKTSACLIRQDGNTSADVSVQRRCTWKYLFHVFKYYDVECNVSNFVFYKIGLGKGNRGFI